VSTLNPLLADLIANPIPEKSLFFTRLILKDYFFQRKKDQAYPGKKFCHIILQTVKPLAPFYPAPFALPVTFYPLPFTLKPVLCLLSFTLLGMMESVDKITY